MSPPSPQETFIYLTKNMCIVHSSPSLPQNLLAYSFPSPLLPLENLDLEALFNHMIALNDVTEQTQILMTSPPSSCGHYLSHLQVLKGHSCF